MQENAEIAPPISYPSVFLAIGIILAIVVVVYIAMVLFFTRNKKAKPAPPPPPPPKPTLHQIKSKYLKMVDDTNRDFIEQKITSSEAHKNLSPIVRSFIYEASGVPFQVMTLSEIINSQKNYTVSQIINEYYPPEFDGQNNGDVARSVEMARKVIESWK